MTVTFDPVPVRGGPLHGQMMALSGGILPAEVAIPLDLSDTDRRWALYSVETQHRVPVYLAFVGYRT